MDKIVIGLGGLIGHGKSEVSKRLTELDSSFVRVAFADTLKDFVEHLHKSCPTFLNLTEKDLASMRTSSKTPRMREVLKCTGTEVVRKVDEDYWVNTLKHNVMDSLFNVVIDDVRFRNELDAFKNQECVSYVSFRIIRKSLIERTVADLRASESQLSPQDFDKIIIIEEGEEAIDKAAKEILSLVYPPEEAEPTMVNVISSNIAQVGFKSVRHSESGDPVGELFVNFTNNSKYKYLEVPMDVFDALISSESVGKIFNALVKKSGYVYERLL